ncbi:hypothetical protein A1Q2_05127 [Trichosporon asahii var. asahii CBS 8904]|uniref:Anhydro-N-acetylmuramic acid kinase n=2 Tax=Trichosporon asahii var. asahii TaxID=189963 RepID=K1VMI2_TRIAC|nr:hypothetical protein A1Q1_06539 [Trichosporon asahii var. asahii CBS 2479]EJT45131.1 hypothetical protein A1Q1_06539 [Trichosporon asahii var. asahii CBS 2479]EKD00577.1 hypothetical protein A1Q2_05127 [Trichosporon asahii var. asahii CBS 8904]
MATLNVLGLNCGTSVDGVDVALVRISALNRSDVSIKLGHYSEHPVPSSLRSRILALCKKDAPTTLEEVCDLNFELGDVFATAALESGVDMSKVDLIASHGQTLWHHPVACGKGGYASGERRAATLQMGESAVIAQRTGVDFRAAELAVGRQGAPLSGILESALLRSDRLVVCQNIGGMANASVVPPEGAEGAEGGWFAYDTGPGNVLIDCAVRTLSDGREQCDTDGRRALAGADSIDEDYVQEWLEQCDYLHRRPPKTTGREVFSESMGQGIVSDLRARGLSDDAIVATVTRLTALSIIRSLQSHVESTHGPIADLLAFPCARVRTLDEARVPAEAKEGVLFALLGYLCVGGRKARVSALESGPEVVLGKITPGDNFTSLMRRALSEEDAEVLGRVVLEQYPSDSAVTFSTVPPLASPADPAEWTRDPAAKHTFGTRRSSFLAVLADDSKPDKIPLSHPSSTTMPRSDHSAPSATPSAPSAPSAPAGPSAPPGPSGATADVAHSSAHPPGIPVRRRPRQALHKVSHSMPRPSAPPSTPQPRAGPGHPDSGESIGSLGRAGSSVSLGPRLTPSLSRRGPQDEQWATILVDDLRWQQSVEMRLQNLQQEIAAVRAANAELQRQVESGVPPRFDEMKHEHTHSHTHAHREHARERERERRDAREAREYHDDPHIRKRHRSSSPIHDHGHGHMRRESASRFVLPSHLHGLREILQPALNELQRPDPLDVSIDDATILWESFYDSLAIFFGFTASTEQPTPSPLLFSAVVTAAAKRFSDRLSTPADRWEELFKRSLIRLLYITVPKTWDDVVGLGIARSFFWKADEITAGLIYGGFVETATPNQSNQRDRRVWDFLEMTSVSHGILHLSIPIMPDRPPRGVPARRTSHLLLHALNELFDALGVVNRSLTTARSIVMTALTGKAGPSPLTYAEVAVLRNCRHDLERWAPKWLYEIQHAENAKLPVGHRREFLLDLISLYYHVALVVVDGYLNQCAQPDTHRLHESASDLLNLAAGKWAGSLHLWPKLFLHTALIAAISLPPEDPLVRTCHEQFVHLSPMFQTSGSKLLQRLSERLERSAADAGAPPPPPLPVFTDIDMSMAYTGSDSFWADISGVLGLDGGVPMPPPGAVMHQEVWQGAPPPRDLDHWGSVRQQ